jgi:hypothetical protein
VKLKLLEPHQGLKAGAEWNCPWATVGAKLIEEGKAVALEECDLHLNPAPPPEPAGDEGEPLPDAPPEPAPKKKAPKKKA